MPETILVIACGALAREIIELKRLNGWNHLALSCIDARLHNRPTEIPERLRARIREQKPHYDRVFVAYADCGTAGGIDRVCHEEGVERLPGADCYQFYAGTELFERLQDAEPGTFYLTDFLVRHFQRFVVKSLKLDSHPELRESYFGNYRKLVYLSQSLDADLVARAASCADFLDLSFQHVHCGYGALGSSLRNWVRGHDDDQENAHLLA